MLVYRVETKEGVGPIYGNWKNLIPDSTTRIKNVGPVLVDMHKEMIAYSVTQGLPEKDENGDWSYKNFLLKPADETTPLWGIADKNRGQGMFSTSFPFLAEYGFGVSTYWVEDENVRISEHAIELVFDATKAQHLSWEPFAEVEIQTEAELLLAA